MNFYIFCCLSIHSPPLACAATRQCFVKVIIKKILISPQLWNRGGDGGKEELCFCLPSIKYSISLHTCKFYLWRKLQIQSCEIPSWKNVFWQLMTFDIPAIILASSWTLCGFSASWNSISSTHTRLNAVRETEIGFYLMPGNWLRKVNIGGRMFGCFALPANVPPDKQYYRQ